MSSAQQSEGLARFTVENVGGIGATEVEVPPGVTVLEGKNATNRTSFLQAIMAAMGSDRATLKGDADRGQVHLEIGGETFERRLQRRNGQVRITGDGYLDDPAVADLFAFLLETNEARQAVARGDDLREIIMRPVDIDEIKADIDRLEQEKGEINDQLADLESLKRDLPDLEQERTSLRNQIEEKREQLREKEQEIEASSSDVEETKQEKQRLEAKLDELRDTRSDLEDIRYDIESQKESIASLKEERSDIEAQLEELPDDPGSGQEDIDERISQLREEKQAIESRLQDLQSIIQFNEEMLENTDASLLEALQDDERSADALTEQLVESEDVVCWTCGSEVTPDTVEATIEELRQLRSDRLSDVSDIEDDLEELTERKRDLEREQRKRERLERRREEIDEEIDQRESVLADLQERKTELTAEIEELENEVDDLESEDFSDVLDLHREANELEFEIDRLESDLEDVEAKIQRKEERIAKEDELRERRDEIVDELEDLRTRIDQIEAEAVEQFNDHMAAMLDLLEYENLERIWIERVERTVREGRQNVERTVFELHVIRSTETGAAYEDTVDHLSESEREVTGLIFALAGYLVHDLHETVPFMVLDSLEAIDSDRIAALVDYFAEYADYLVVALLPEDAQALTDSYKCNFIHLMTSV